MAGITLKYPSSGSVTQSVVLPWPAHNQQIGNFSNQSVNRTPSGTDYEIDHGPAWFQIARTFEALSNAEVQAFYTFYEAIGNAAGEFLYCYTDAGGTVRSTVVQILEPPKETRLMRGMHDLTIVFVQSKHPDGINDTGSFGNPRGGGTSGNGTVDPGTITYPLISSVLAASINLGQSFTYVITAVGAPTITYAASALPAGLSLSVATISGTPTTAGTYFITISATNSNGTDQQVLSLSVVGPSNTTPTIVGPLRPFVFADSPFTATYYCTGAPTVSLSAGPNTGGIAVSGHVVTGTFPSPAGTQAVTLTGSNAYGTTTGGVVFTVLDALPAAIPTITSPTSWSSVVSTAFNYVVTAVGQGPITYGATGLPSGLSINSATGVISGTPPLAGTTSVVISAANGSGTATASLAIAITSAGVAPAITSASSISTIGSGYPVNFPVTASGSRPIVFTAADLPPECSIDSATGRITGNLEANGSVTAHLTVTNGFGSSSFGLALNTSSPSVIAITGSTAVSCAHGVPTSYTIAHTGTPFSDGIQTPVFQYQVANVPPGMALNLAAAPEGLAVLSGTPTTPGTYNTIITIKGFGYPGMTTGTFIVVFTIT